MLGRVNNMPVDRLRLPIAEASFEKIRLSHKLYVDKTALVGKLAWATGAVRSSHFVHQATALW